MDLKKATAIMGVPYEGEVLWDEVKKLYYERREIFNLFFPIPENKRDCYWELRDAFNKVAFAFWRKQIKELKENKGIELKYIFECDKCDQAVQIKFIPEHKEWALLCPRCLESLKEKEEEVKKALRILGFPENQQTIENKEVKELYFKKREIIGNNDLPWIPSGKEQEYWELRDALSTVLLWLWAKENENQADYCFCCDECDETFWTIKEEINIRMALWCDSCLKKINISISQPKPSPRADFPPQPQPTPPESPVPPIPEAPEQPERPEPAPRPFSPPPLDNQEEKLYGKDYKLLTSEEKQGRKKISDQWKEAKQDYQHQINCKYCQKAFAWDKTLSYLAAKEKSESELQTHQKICPLKNNLEEIKKTRQKIWEEERASKMQSFYTCPKCWGKIDLDKKIDNAEQAKKQALADWNKHVKEECKKAHKNNNQHADLNYAESIEKEPILEKNNQGKVYQKDNPRASESTTPLKISVALLLLGSVICLALFVSKKKKKKTRINNIN